MDASAQGGNAPPSNRLPGRGRGRGGGRANRQGGGSGRGGEPTESVRHSDKPSGRGRGRGRKLPSSDTAGNNSRHRNSQIAADDSASTDEVRFLLASTRGVMRATLLFLNFYVRM